MTISMGIFAKETGEKGFWKWFQKNESTIFQSEINQKQVLDNISEHLSKYKEGLVFEISQENNGKREFIISADGLKELFPAVESLKVAAPRLERWSIVAFRPRMKDYATFKLDYAGKKFDPEEIWIYPRIREGHFDLIIYHPLFAEKERNSYVSGAYILLDMALGEYDVVTGIRYIDHQKLPNNPESEGLKPFSELRKVFDDYKAKKG
jgi:hypothetical protein